MDKKEVSGIIQFIIQNMFFAIIVYTIITLSWIGLEYMIDGEIITQNSDNVIAVLMTLYLFNQRVNKRANQ